MTDQPLSFYRWVRLRDFVNEGLALRRPDVQEFIHEGYLERNDQKVIPTAKGLEALKHEPAA